MSRIMIFKLKFTWGFSFAISTQLPLYRCFVMLCFAEFTSTPQHNASGVRTAGCCCIAPQHCNSTTAAVVTGEGEVCCGRAAGRVGPVLLLVLRGCCCPAVDCSHFRTVVSERGRDCECCNRGEWWHYYRSNYQQNIKMEYWVRFLLDCKTMSCKVLKFFMNYTTYCAAGK